MLNRYAEYEIREVYVENVNQNMKYAMYKNMKNIKHRNMLNANKIVSGFIKS